MIGNQGKTPKQQKDSNLFTMIGYIGIVLVVSLILIGIGEYTGFNQDVQKGLKDDPRPKSHLWNYSHPDMWVNDSLPLLDTLGLNKTDTVEWQDMMGIDGDCGDKEYSDEDVMWIGGDGDTIWE